MLIYNNSIRILEQLFYPKEELLQTLLKGPALPSLSRLLSTKYNFCSSASSEILHVIGR